MKKSCLSINPFNHSSRQYAWCGTSASPYTLSAIFAPVSFKSFEEAYKALTEKLQPMVYELGFLKV
jgi:hypothetical protein